MIRHKKHPALHDPSNIPLLELRCITRKFGVFPAVNEVSLNVYRGEIFCLLGGSGCGKTTLLRLIAGFEKPDSGKILLEGQELTGIPPYDRPVNMMFQSYALFPHMTVTQNVGFGLKQAGLPKNSLRTRVAEMLALVKLSEFGARKPHQLSGGQQQRVALARALVLQPKILLLDEPLAALDRKLRESTQAELKGLQEQLGITFKVVTHDQNEAMSLATRIGVMNNGKIQQTGSPREIYESPANHFVANFVGDVNLFEGELIEWGPEFFRFRVHEADCIFRSSAASELPSGAAASLALRPEKIAFSCSPMPNGQDNATSGTLESVTYLGDLSLLSVRLASGRRIKISRPNAQREEQDLPSRGQTLYLRWSADSLVVLPK